MVTRTAAGCVHYACPACGGVSGNLALLRQSWQPEFANTLWRAVRDAHPTDHGGALPCPSCRKRMHVAALQAAEGGEVQLDVCRTCQLVWLDAGEAERLPRRAPGRAGKHEPPSLDPEAAEALAPFLLERDRHRIDSSWGEGSNLPGQNAPDETWAAVMTYLGFPVEENAPTLRCRPYLTWSIAALCVMVTLGAMFAGGLSAAISRYGFVPAEPLRAGGITAITAFFLHAGWLHLAFNVWFLLIAGDNCEDLLGKPCYLLVLAGGTAVALMTHALFDPRPAVPLVGASGGISALLAFYALALPEVRLALCLRLGWYPFWFRLSAAWAVALWVGWQVIGALLQLNGASSTSSLAHLGGAIAGGVAWAAWRSAQARRQATRRPG